MKLKIEIGKVYKLTTSSGNFISLQQGQNKKWNVNIPFFQISNNSFVYVINKLLINQDSYLNSQDDYLYVLLTEKGIGTTFLYKNTENLVPINEDK